MSAPGSTTAPEAPPLTAREVAALRQLRATLRQQRTRAQNEADRFGARAAAITAALVAAGVEVPQGHDHDDAGDAA